MMTFRNALGWMVAILVVASGIRFAELDTRSIWFDEGWSAYAAVQPTLLDAARADLTNPPLYYVLLHITTRFIGSSEYALRWVSSALNLLTIALLYALTRHLFNRRAAVFAAFLGASSALLWWASREARMYTLLALLVTLAVFAWQRLLHRPTWRNWLFLWAAELGLLYAHNTGPIAVVWLNAVTLAAWLTRHSLREPDWKLWIGGQFIVLIAWLPWLEIFLGLREANAALANAPSLTLQFALEVWTGLIVGVWPIAQSSMFTASTLLVLGCAFAILPWKSATARWLVLHTGMLISGIIAGLVILANEYHGRYAVMALPPLLAALGAGLARLRWRGAAVGLAVGFALVTASVAALAQEPQFSGDDVRGMVRHYATTLSEQDSVIAWSYADRYDLLYYWERLGVRARHITLPEGADQQSVAALLPATGGVSVNIWYTQRGDYRGMLPCLLGHRTARVPTEYTTNGMTNLHFTQRAAQLPQTTPLALLFTRESTPIARLREIGTLPPTRADQALCIPVILQAEQAGESQLSAALIVRNALGWEIARADAFAATADQRTLLNAGDTAAAYPLLRLPFGAPAGEYPVFLRLYDAQTMPSGYTPSGTQATLSGRDVLLGMWRVTASTDWATTGRLSEIPYNDTPVTSSLRLAGLQLGAPSPLHNGDSLDVTLLWEGTGEPPRLVLQDDDGRWDVLSAGENAPVNGYLLDWRRVRIPNEAPDGTATLNLENGAILGHFPVENIPALDAPPSVQHRVSATFPAVGDLVGYSWSDDVQNLSTQPEVTLVWQARAAPVVMDYTVFVQLLDPSGVVIAQSDSMPEEGERPTSGWRADEFIVDTHRLTFNANARSGPARLIIGWYNTSNNERLLLSTGEDYMLLETTEISP